MSARDLRLDRHLEGRLSAGGSAGGGEALEARAAALLDLPPGATVLDAGCGCGDLVRRLEARGFRARGVDVCANLLARARRAGGLYARGDAARLPFRGAAFDGAASILVFHYLESPPAALAELGRVLRPGGRLVVADRVAAEDAVLRAAQEGVERLRNPLLRRILRPAELRGLLESAGFAIEAESPFELLRDRSAWTAGAAGDEALRLAEALTELEGRDLEGLAVEPGRVRLRGRIWACRR
jgi:SAM-dependent methyltransferase